MTKARIGFLVCGSLCGLLAAGALVMSYRMRPAFYSKRAFAFLQSEGTVAWLEERSREVTRDVGAGRVAVVGNAVYWDRHMPYAVALRHDAFLEGSGGIGADGFPWERLGLKSGVIRVFQMTKTPYGNYQPRLEFVPGIPVDVVFVGNPTQYGFYVITGKLGNEMFPDNSRRGTGDIIVWHASGHYGWFGASR